jgi:hypothetical protein
VIVTAYARSSVMVTTNLPFENRTEVLGSERLTEAALDRLTYRCKIIETKGESYRLQDAARRSRDRKSLAKMASATVLRQTEGNNHLWLFSISVHILSPSYASLSKRHEAGQLSYFAHPITNDGAEELNSRGQRPSDPSFRS